MAEELRFDAGRLGKVQRTPGGGVRVPASVTRTGLLNYRRADGSVRVEFRPRDEVFRADSLATLRGAAVTEGHVAMVTPENWQDVARGHAYEAREDGEKVTTELDITAAGTIARIDSGELAEVSMGYTVDYDPTPGVHNGQRYDGVQRNIKYNHVALLPRGGGRAGRDIGLRLDSSSAVCDTELETSTTEKEPTKVADKIFLRLDGRDVEKGSDDHIKYLESQTETERKRAETEKTRADKAEGERDTLKTENAKLVDAAKPERLDALLNAKAELRANASAILGSEYKFDGKSDREIMCDVIRSDRKDFTGLEADGKTLKSEDYVRASYDGVVARGVVRADGVESLPGKIASLRENPKPKTVDLDRFDAETDWAAEADKQEKEMRRANANAWRTPVESAAE